MRLFLFILILGAVLRFYRLEELVPFFSDQGWYYVQAKEIVTEGNFPLVGITSSHTWLHQSAFWSYMLAPLLLITNFNPFSGVYFIALLSLLTMVALYFVAKEMFSERVALITTLLYAVSPLVIVHSRLSYHTSPIPFFSTLLIYAVYKWVSGNIKYFPIIIFLSAILYNFELATFTLAPIIGLFLLYGFVKKKKWVTGLWNKRTIVYSILGFLVPMLPMLIYDIGHGFPQTIKFVVWVFYRIAVFLGYPPLHPEITGETWTTFFNYTFMLLRRLIYADNLLIALALFISAILISLYLIYKRWKKKEKIYHYIVALLYVLVPVMGYIAAKTNSEAYTLIFFPSVMLLFGISFDYLMREKLSSVLVIGLIATVAATNVNHLLSRNYLMWGEGYGVPLPGRIDVAKSIIDQADGRMFKIEGKGPGSQYESFVTPYTYLTEWLGRPATNKNEELKFYVREYPDKIDLKVEE